MNMKPYFEGYDAYCTGKEREDNPYPPGYPAWNVNKDWEQWDSGWLSAKHDCTHIF